MAAAREELDRFQDSGVPLLAKAVLEREALVDIYLALRERAPQNEAHAKLAEAREYIDYTLLKNKGKGFTIEHLHVTLWTIRASDASEDHKKKAIRFLLDYIPPDIRAAYDKANPPAAPVAAAMPLTVLRSLSARLRSGSSGPSLSGKSE